MVALICAGMVVATVLALVSAALLVAGFSWQRWVPWWRAALLWRLARAIFLAGLSVLCLVRAKGLMG